MKHLILLELKRSVRPFLLSLSPVVAFVVLKTALSGSSAETMQLVAVVAMTMGTLSVPAQVARDRTSGALAYFGSLPVSGAMLLGVRVATLGVFLCVGLAIALPSLVLSGSLPIAGLSLFTNARLVLSALVGLFCLALILVGLLSRYDMGRLLGAAFVIFLFSSLLQPTISARFGPRLGSVVAQPTAQLIVLAGGVAMVLLLAGAVLSARLAIVTMQPHGAAATARAKETLSGLRG